jgi:hypothetical protein
MVWLPQFDHTDEPGVCGGGDRDRQEPHRSCAPGRWPHRVCDHPRAVARYRERSAQTGGTSDPGDAIVKANILRCRRTLGATLTTAPNSSASRHGIESWRCSLRHSYDLRTTSDAGLVPTVETFGIT